MLFAFLYSLLRLLRDVADVRLRVGDPEAELLLLRSWGCNRVRVSHGVRARTGLEQGSQERISNLVISSGLLR
jgi:hypothetical protein